MRPVLGVAASRGYDPPHEGEETPARPARMPIFQSLAIRARQAVAEDRLFIRRIAPPPQAAQPRGAMTPFEVRGNIPRSAPDAWGSQFVLDPNHRTQRLDPLPLAGMP